MSSARHLHLQVLGMLDAQRRTELLKLTPQRRRRLLNRALLKVRSLARRNISAQRDTDGKAFAPRRRQAKRKMLRRLVSPKHLNITQLTADGGTLGWRNGLMGYIARQHQDGHTERRTAAQMRRWSKTDPGGACSERQAKRLRRLGFKVRQAGRKALARPSVAWIREHLSYGQAGLLVRRLRGDAPGASQWDIQLPQRAFLGTSDRDVRQLLAQALDQILTSPR